MFWVNGWVSVYELRGCGFESSSNHEKYYCVENVLLPILKMFGRIVQQSLAQSFNSHWHDCSTVTGMILQQSLARLFNSHWHDWSTVAVMIVQQSLARLFNSHWHNWSTLAGTIIQQSLTGLFNSHWHDSSTVTGAILQQSLAGLFNSHKQIFSFFYAGRILQQWSTLLKNRATYQKYGTWSWNWYETSFMKQTKRF